MAKTTTRKHSRKMQLEKASASEIITALGIRPAEERRATAAVAAAERVSRRGTAPERKLVSGKVVRMTKRAP
jgi:hypothetical protein